VKIINNKIETFILKHSENSQVRLTTANVMQNHTISEVFSKGLKAFRIKEKIKICYSPALFLFLCPNSLCGVVKLSVGRSQKSGKLLETRKTIQSVKYV